MALGFLITAFLYATVGFGGGSTYNALLLLNDVDYNLIPKIALTCNIIVVTGSAIRYYKNNLIPWKIVIPLILVSIPFALLGGLINIDKETFLLILSISLILSGIFLFIRQEEILEISQNTKEKKGLILYTIISSILGFLAGIVGIGGGIFFSPILHITKAMPSKNIEAFSSIYILVNSIFGLLGQFIKDQNEQTLINYFNYSLLFFAVLFGGLIGSHLGIKTLKPIIVRRLTAILIIFVGLRLIIGI